MLEDVSRHILQNLISLRKNISAQMLSYKWKYEVGNLREFGLNVIQNAPCSIGRYVPKTHKFQNEIWTKK